MSAISFPPTRIRDPWQVITADHPARIVDYLSLANPIDRKGRYLHYDDLRFRLPKGIDHALAWSALKLSREQQYHSSVMLGEPLWECRFLYTPSMHLAVSACDQNTTTALLEWMCSETSDGQHLHW